MSNTSVTTSKPNTTATNEELPYAPRSPTPEEGELVEHPDATVTTVISHDPYITETLVVTDINGEPVLDAGVVSPSPIPIRLRASAAAFAPTLPLDIPRSISPRTDAQHIAQRTGKAPIL
jgi:hypothetical protein